MRRLGKATLVLLAACVALPLSASDFVVVAAVGAVDPEGLAAGQELANETRLSLEPWGRVVVREASGCGLTHVIAGAREHPLRLMQDCESVADPLEVVAMIQQGGAFAAPLPPGDQTDQLAQMLAREPCVFMARVSEEGGNARHCPSGYALRALRCSGEHCDNKDLLCCPYLGGEPDPDTKEIASRLISEEFPSVLQSKHFLNGLACNGPYCDNIMPYQFRSARLKNTKSCEWSPWSTEQPDAWIDCGDGRLISGVRCQSDYCGNVGVFCCGAEVK